MVGIYKSVLELQSLHLSRSPLGPEERIMSTTETTATELAQIFQVLASTDSTVLAVCTLLIYDWVICLDQEISAIWSKPRTGASILYLFNRYSLLASYILNMSTIGRICVGVLWLSIVLEFSFLLSPAVFSSLRVYALTEQNKALSGLTLALGMMPFIVNVATAYQTQVTNSPVVGCSNVYNTPDAIVFLIPIILCDTVVVMVTWMKVFRGHQYLKGSMQQPTLHLVMLENGIILLCLNGMQIILNIPSLVAILPQESYFSEFIDPITSVLTSHFILNLRAVHEQQSSCSVPSIVFLENRTAEEQTFLNSLTGPVHSFSDCGIDTIHSPV
ncbi:hypothetical protein PYCCODRAFT_1437914 [Trametes coccinea BRFM310]|uniref:DUF6533 domain-containing protein n=1 Tax=Trametes coccinea (strain BRFM310) TaxID=1353009 RepID=A0A1Y2IFQ2_TRAC3|nr:hypothetical protein PYCCODRAFT_1437914 [Trametes coccinea BRFM310]